MNNSRYFFMHVCVCGWVCVCVSVFTGDGQNNGALNSIRINMCWLPWKNICCIFLCSVGCLRCVAPVSMHYRLCLVRVRMKVPQNRRLVRFSKRADCWRTFSWRVCNQNGHFIRCIQSSIFQCDDGVHKSWEDIISWEEQWPKIKTKWKGSPYIEEDCV